MTFSAEAIRHAVNQDGSMAIIMNELLYAETKSQFDTARIFAIAALNRSEQALQEKKEAA